MCGKNFTGKKKRNTNILWVTQIGNPRRGEGLSRSWKGGGRKGGETILLENIASYFKAACVVKGKLEKRQGRKGSETGET